MALAYQRVRVSLHCLRYLNQLEPLAICQSEAGYYLGANDQRTGEPLARDSAEYWPSAEEARVALRIGEWTQRASA